MREDVKLQQPTDFLILEFLEEGGRNVASNISIEIDKSRSHVNVRLPILEDYGLVKKIGPSENSGLYEITEKGQLALEHQEEYSENQGLFESALESDLDAEDLEDDADK